MKQKNLEILILVFFVAVFFVFYLYQTQLFEVNPIFISVSTFLFVILVGFFISRQSQRYQSLRKLISDFDGSMSAVYRNMQHFGDEIQSKAGVVIKNHYQKIIKSGSWDYYFTHKSSTLTDLHNLLDSDVAVKKNLNDVQKFAIVTTMSALVSAQGIRKNLVSLHLEKIPQFQTVLIYFLTVIVLLSISSLDTQYDLLGAGLKAAFVTAVVAAIILLRQLDKLALFEGVIGSSSARDVVEIIDGKK